MTMKKAELERRKAELQEEIADINRRLSVMEKLEKPFEACVHGYSSPGISSTYWKTEEQARKKYDDYRSKRFFRNGAVYGVILYRSNEDGTRTVLDYDWRSRFGMPDEIKALEESQ
jgi:hypothetical protein